MRLTQRGQTTLEALLCLVPAILLALAAALLLWKGLGERCREYQQFTASHRALLRNMR